MGLFETLGLRVCELVVVPQLVTLLVAVRVGADDEELEGEGLTVVDAVWVEQLDGEAVAVASGEAVALGDPLLQRLVVAVAEVEPELLALCDGTAVALEHALAVVLAVDEFDRTGVNEVMDDAVALADPVNEALPVALDDAQAEPVPLPLRVAAAVAVLEKQELAEKCDAVPVWSPVTVPEILGEAEAEGLREVAAVVLADTVPLRLLLFVGVAVLDTHALKSGDGDTKPLALALGLADVNELVADDVGVAGTLLLAKRLEEALGEPDRTIEFEGSAVAVRGDNELDGDSMLEVVAELQGLADAVALLQGDTLAEGVGDRERVTEPVAELQALPLRDRVLVTVGELEAQLLALVVTVGLAVPLMEPLGHLETGAVSDSAGVLEGDTLADAEPDSPMVADGLALVDPLLLRDRVFVTVTVPDAHDVGDTDAGRLALLPGVGVTLPLVAALSVGRGENEVALDPDSAALAEKWEAVTDRVAELH